MGIVVPLSTMLMSLLLQFVEGGAVKPRVFENPAISGDVFDEQRGGLGGGLAHPFSQVQCSSSSESN
jgi:hypothetical protein